MSIEKKIISKKEFNEMKMLFNDSIKPALEENYTNFVNMPIQDLKDYISLIEQEAKDNDTQVKNVLFQFVADIESNQLTIALQPDFENSEIEGSIMDKNGFCPPYCGGL